MNVKTCAVVFSCKPCKISYEVRSNETTIIFNPATKRPWIEHICPQCNRVGNTLIGEETALKLCYKGAVPRALKHSAESIEWGSNEPRIDATDLKAFRKELKTDIMKRVKKTARDSKVLRVK